MYLRKLSITCTFQNSINYILYSKAPSRNLIGILSFRGVPHIPIHYKYFIIRNYDT